MWVDNGRFLGDTCEEYFLDGFERKPITITSASDFPEDILDELKPKCPQCGETGKVKEA